MHEYLLDDLSAQEGYKLLRDIVTPRPIALVTTVGTDGLVNAAPFSFFNAIAYDPCMVVLGLRNGLTIVPRIHPATFGTVANLS